MAWILDWLFKEGPGPKEYYVAWKSRGTEPPRTLFEYIVHPVKPNDGWIYCAAIVNAENKQNAWQKIAQSFTDAELQLIDVADQHRLCSYENVRKVVGVTTISPHP